MIYVIDVSTFVMMSMSMSQPSTLMAPSEGDDDTINDVSMVDPQPLATPLDVVVNATYQTLQ
jgi:hypothetical protein